MAGDPGGRIPAAEKLAFERGEHPLQAGGTAVIDALTQAPPKSLTKEAKAIWTAVVGAMLHGTYAATDTSQLIVFCEARATFDKATAMIQKEGYLATGSTGQVTISPWVTIQEKAAARIDKIGSTLFLTPTARQAMRDTPVAQAQAKTAEIASYGGLIGGRA